MPKKEQFRLHPLGYENDPEEERFRFSTIDYLTACTYNNYALFIELDDADKSRVATVLKEGLERTLSQCRHLVGTIEKNPYGDHSFVKKKHSTVEFNVQWLDSPEDNFPSFSDLEKSHFASSSLGDIKLLSVDGMTYGEKPECSPNASPVVSAFQANFIPGGLIFNMHHHHHANDVMGWASFVHQLADNCDSIISKTGPPGFDPACLDHSRLIPKDIPDEAKVDGPPPPERHPGHPPSSSLLFHLPKSKAAELKKIAMPTDGSWVSTYDAFSAFIWRVLSKHRIPVYKPDLASPALWGEGIDMRDRLRPQEPTRTQGNVFWAAQSATAPTQLTLSEVTSEAPLSRLASYIRSLTDTQGSEESLHKALAMVAPIRDKSSLFIRVDSFPPMTVVMTDWRNSRVCEADFSFGQVKAFRHLFNTVTEGMTVVYPPRVTGDPDEGCEFAVSCEDELVKQVIEDPEMKEYFEFRGFDVKSQ